jgi:hypothetical protein
MVVGLMRSIQQLGFSIFFTGGENCIFALRSTAGRQHFVVVVVVDFVVVLLLCWPQNVMQ